VRPLDPGRSLDDPQLRKAIEALGQRRPQAAESVLRRFLEENEGHPAAMTLLAEALLHQDRVDDARELLGRVVALAPDFAPARHNLVTALLTQNRPGEAFAEIDALLGLDPGNPAHRNLKAMAHVWIGQHDRAAAEYEIVLASGPRHPGPWLSYANTLRILDRHEACVAAYRKAMELFPRLGDPYWSLASLQTFRFSGEEIARMRALLAAGELPVESRIQIRFALAKALGDEGDRAAAFEHYSEANALKRATLSYNAELTSAYVLNCRTLFTPGFLAAARGSGSQASDPVFVVGLPRSGSTLVEQILASHSQIEGTMELRILPYLVGRMGAGGSMRFIPGQTNRALRTDTQAPYPEILRNLGSADFAALAEEYLERARVFRVLGRRHFIDKMPDNFAHIGLIHLMLPNAKIVDVRRHPMACCLSNFRHYFPLGKDFSYSLADLGRYYADYVELMSHFDEVLPGKVHRVFYERLVADPETEIRRLFDYLGLGFEEAALRFHENARPVRTASSEQVRMPIFRDALESWRAYEEWLEPLRAALGPALSGYPVPP
jgi:tetratricopeptide (TPR) repeat protein